MDLQDQLQNLFPDHKPSEESSELEKSVPWKQVEPIICKYEKRKGKPLTILEGYLGPEAGFKELTKALKISLGVGGTAKNGSIIIQGDYREKIMEILQKKGFKVKRVGG